MTYENSTNNITNISTDATNTNATNTKTKPVGPPPLDPSKYHVINKKKRGLYLIVIIFVILIIVPLVSFFYYKFAVTRPNQTDREISFTIESGESVNSVSQRLYDQEAVNSAFLFKIYVLINNLQNKIQAGEYIIPAGTAIDEIAYMFQDGRNDKTVTFLEGWRNEQIAQEASRVYEKIDYSDFSNKAIAFQGKLFPDTYSFSSDVTEDEMIEKMVENYDLKTKDLLTNENLKRAQLTADEALIIASIVEREVSNSKDKRIVAGILINRLRIGEILGADATTQYYAVSNRYACDRIETDKYCPNAEEIPNINWWPNDLTIEELQTKNPYNTRAVVGLPPKPISNPSLDSIEAVVFFEDTDYLYYLNDATGRTILAKTLPEHNQNVAKYLN